jgi:hypothetical protein
MRSMHPSRDGTGHDYPQSVVLSTTFGSSRAARQAGIQQATVDVMASSAPTATYVAMSSR